LAGHDAIWALGIDGCRGGWVGVAALWRDGRVVEWSLRTGADAPGVLALEPAPVSAAIDIPIGLLDARQAGGRECDRLARKALGPRAASVFSPPPRPALAAKSYDEARPFGLTIQAFHIMPKIAEVERWITPERQRLLVEAHPEFAFRCLTGAPMAFPKRSREGRAERLAALAPLFPDLAERIAARPFARAQVAPDDIIDACALAWVACRRWLGRAVCLPASPPRDSRGLEMAIWG